MADEYEVARLKAAGETGLPVESFPASEPYSVAEILSDAFYPGES